MKQLTELNENPLMLSVTFECLYAPDYHWCCSITFER